jgi:hypothetical protein
MRRLPWVVVLTAALAVTVALPVSAAPPAESGERDWFIGQAVLDELGFPGAGEASVGTASNGDVITLQMDSAPGTLNSKTKAATGQGTFVHTDASGAVLGAGDWMVTRLLNWDEWGPGDDLTGEGDLDFSQYLAGRARFKIDLKVDSAVVATGTLEVVCVLPGAYNPAITSNIGGPTGSGPAWSEGIKLNINGSLNFNMGPPSPTLFDN